MDWLKHLQEEQKKDFFILKELEDKFRYEDNPIQKHKWDADIKTIKQRIKKRKEEIDLEEEKITKKPSHAESRMKQPSKPYKTVSRRNVLLLAGLGGTTLVTAVLSSRLGGIPNPIQDSPRDKSISEKKGESPTPTPENEYFKLEKLLADGKWREANQETSDILLKYSSKGEHLDTDAYAERIPLDVYFKIDKLWVDYSEGLYGMSVQNSIWEKLNKELQSSGINCSDGNYEETWVKKCAKEFGKKVKLVNEEGRYLLIRNLKYNEKIPGHLPVIGKDSASTSNLTLRIKNQLYLGTGRKDSK